MKHIIVILKGVSSWIFVSIWNSPGVIFYYWFFFLEFRNKYLLVAPFCVLFFYETYNTRVVCYVTRTDTWTSRMSPRGRFIQLYNIQLYNLKRGKLTKSSSSPKGLDISDFIVSIHPLRGNPSVLQTILYS